jgi:uncharacterized membrane protein YtjA (UPF0391 family)
MSGVKGCAALAARVLAGLAAAALVVLLPVTLLARNIALVLFEPQALTQAVSERLIESGMLRETIVKNLLGEETGLGGLSLETATHYLTPEERGEMIDLLVPEAWLKDQILQVTTQFFAWFDDPSTRLVLTVDTGRVAAGLEGEASARVVEMVVESWPACTLADVGKMIGIGAIPGEQGFPYCEPPEPLRSVVVSAAAGALQLLGESLPARLAVVDQGFKDSDKLMQTKEQVRMLRFVARWGIIVSLALLGVITMLAVRSWKGLTRWWGIPLLLGGLLAFLPVLLGGRILHLLVSWLTAGLSGLPALTELAQALGEAIGAEVLRPQAWQAALVTFIGLVLLLLSLIGRRRPTADPAHTPEAPAQVAEPLLTPRAAPENTQKRPSGMFG